MLLKRTSGTAVLLCTALALLVGCAQSGMSGSRHALYTSVDEIGADSSVIATVEVTHTEDLKGEDVPMSVATAVVAEPLVVEGIGEAIPGGAITLEPGDRLEIKQLGWSSMDETPAPLLHPGRIYLLFLTPTRIEGDAENAFFITGGDAGIYEAADNGAFVHVGTESGDTLPREIDVSGSELVDR